MEVGSPDDSGGGKKVGLARLAKNHSLSGSLNSLISADSKSQDSRDEPSRGQKPLDTPPETQISPLRSLGKQTPTVTLLPNKMNVSELSGQPGDRRSKTEEDNLSLDSLGHAVHVPCSDPDFLRNGKSGIRPSQSLPLGNLKDGDEMDGKHMHKMKGSDTPKKSPPLLSRRARLAPPKVKRSSSMTRLSEAFSHIHNICVFPAHPRSVTQNVEGGTKSSEQPSSPQPPPSSSSSSSSSSVRFPECEVLSPTTTIGSVPLTPLTATYSRVDKMRPQSPKLARSTAFRENVKENNKRVSPEFVKESDKAASDILNYTTVKESKSYPNALNNDIFKNSSKEYKKTPSDSFKDYQKVSPEYLNTTTTLKENVKDTYKFYLGSYKETTKENKRDALTNATLRDTIKEHKKFSAHPLKKPAASRVPEPKPPDPISPVSLLSESSPECVDPSSPKLSTNVIENGVCSAYPSSTEPQVPSSSSSKSAYSTSSESTGAAVVGRERTSQKSQHHRAKTERRSRRKNGFKGSSGGLLDCPDPGAELKHASSAPVSLAAGGSEEGEEMMEGGDDDPLGYDAPYHHSPREQDRLTRSPSWYGYKKSSAASRDADDQEQLSGSPLPGCRSASLDELNNLGLTPRGLPMISPLDAKKKNYLFGGLNSLLGASELDRYFPSRTINIFIATWNMNGKEPPVNLEAFLLPDDLEHMPDMFVIGTQESGGSRTEWEVRLQATIGPSHVLFTSAIFGVLHLTIFMRRDLLWFCSVPEEATYSLRPGIAYKTKGGVGLGFQFFGTRLLFINSHLTAHEEKQAYRIQNFRNIIRSLDIPRLLPRKHKSKDVTHQYDSVFWLGDLNFRLAVNRDHVFDKLKHCGPDTYQHLLQWDQLTQARQKGEAFSEFEEGTITFAPTFKYDPGTDHYDTSSKQRVPSYTDRILFKSSRGGVTCQRYGSCSLFRTSDHKPVLGTFHCKIRPGKDDVPLAAGLFNRDVYLEALKRRRRFLYQPALRSCPVQ